MTVSRRPEVAHYKRNAAHVTSRPVLHALEKEELLSAAPAWKRKKLRAELEEQWATLESEAIEEGIDGFRPLRRSIEALEASFEELAGLQIPELLGKVEMEQQKLKAVRAHLESAQESLRSRDFGAAGASTDQAGRELWVIGGPLVVALNQALSQAAIGKAQRLKLQQNMQERQAAKQELNNVRAEQGTGTRQETVAKVHLLEAKGFQLAAEVLATQIRTQAAPETKISREGSLRVVPPQECPTFADVGGLEDVKEQLRSTVGAILERPDEAAKYHVIHNGILFYGPPGTGKTLLSRALAGEYGMRYIRFNPASIASAYIHEAAANLQKLFELARENTPCVLFLDEVDTIASARDDEASADHREVVTQLMNSLEEYRSVPGLLIAAATNNIDRLDPGLREGRFDSKIYVPLPDPQSRAEVLRVHLQKRSEAVDMDTIDFDDLAARTSGRNGAALEAFVSLAAQRALQSRAKIDHAALVDAIKQREGKDRLALDQPIQWDDVILPDETREQVMEILNVFSHPEMARSLGVKAPAGVLLHGPPGTGKTTIAKAMASQIAASFYEQSAADLLSKWAGESEERVAKLFVKARANRPSIIFIDEIDSLLRRRSNDSVTPWEERVVSQFLRELDGLSGGGDVLLVGATNRIDVVDPAVQGRRLTPIEVGLPDGTGRLMLLRVLCRDVRLADDVDLKKLAADTEGMSGADLKRVRDAAGMKALSRATREGTPVEEVSVSMTDLVAALAAQRGRSSLVQV